MFFQDQPKSITDCFQSNGDLDLDRYQAYTRTTAEQSRKHLADAIGLPYKREDIIFDNDNVNGANTQQEKETKTRRPRYVLAKRNEDGTVVPILPKESNWWVLYVQSPLTDDDR
mmetsp:Transcript_25411/g.53537  ORF Transcript_25411/g.53537 Transcript_25411/m.53537 type:complete len:114 (-) Transcript_25411:447-788(-)